MHKTITIDQGCEFSDYQSLEQKMKCKVYYYGGKKMQHTNNDELFKAIVPEFLNATCVARLFIRYSSFNPRARAERDCVIITV